MENEKTKNNSGLIILLVLIILGLAGYIVYDKVLSNKKETEPEIHAVEDNQNIEKIVENNETQVLSTKIGDFIVDTMGSVYYVPRDTFNLLGNTTNLDFTDSSKIGELSKYKVNGYRLIAGTNEYEEFEGYKLDLTDIMAAYECYFGNGGQSDSIIFITKNGEINIFTVYLETDSNGKYNVNLTKNASEHKNIVSVVSNLEIGGSNVLLIDKDGNKYKYNYNYSES